MHGADERANHGGSSRRGWQLRSAAHHKVAEHLWVPACLASLDICHTCSPPLLQTPTVTLLQPFPVSTVWAIKVCLDAFRDAGLHGDDHYVPAVGQTEAPSGSAATAAAAQRRTRAYYLPWCEWIDCLTHTSPWKLLQLLAISLINPKMFVHINCKSQNKCI